MRFSFPLFSSHLDLAHSLWEKILEKDDAVIDATCGNGKDSLALAQVLQRKGGGSLTCLDIQEKALEQTRACITEHCPAFLPCITLLHQSHEALPLLPHLPKLIVYNLGYLPGGNKALTTKVSSTLQSMEKALDILVCGGVISVTCYPGHAEGAEEYKQVLLRLKSLDPAAWSVNEIAWSNRNASPILIVIQKYIPNSSRSCNH